MNSSAPNLTRHPVTGTSRWRHGLAATFVAATVVAATLAVTACGAGISVDDARTQALAQLDELPFVDNPAKTRREVTAAATTDEITNLMRLAKLDNDTRADTFWTCAANLQEVLPDSRWATLNFTTDATGFNDYRLTLGGDGAASLTIVGGAEAVGTHEPTAASKWLLEATDQITGWEADVDTAISSKTFPTGQRAVLSGTNRCQMPFTLTLTAADNTQQQAEAYLDRTHTGEVTLVVDEVSFDLAED